MKRPEILAKFDEIVAFAEIERVHRHAGEALLERDVSAARVRRRGAPRTGDPAGRRGARRRRCSVPEAVPRQDERRGAGRPHRHLRQPQPAGHSAAVLSCRDAGGGTGGGVRRYLHGRGAVPVARLPPACARAPAIDVSGLPRTGTGTARFVTVSYTNGTAASRAETPIRTARWSSCSEIESDAPRDVRSLAVFLHEQYGTKVLNADTLHLDRTISLRQGRNRLRLRIPSIHLMPGTYRVGLWLADPVQAQSVTGAYDYVESAFEIEVVGARRRTVPARDRRARHLRLRGRGAVLTRPWAQGQSRNCRQGIRAGGVGGLASLVRRKLADLHGDSTRGLRATTRRAMEFGVRPHLLRGRVTHLPAHPRGLRAGRAPRHHRRAQRRAVRPVVHGSLPGARRPPLCVSRQRLHRRHGRQALRLWRRDGAPDRCAVPEVREHDEALPRGAVLSRQVEPLRRHRRALRLPVRARTAARGLSRVSAPAPVHGGGGADARHVLRAAAGRSREQARRSADGHIHALRHLRDRAGTPTSGPIRRGRRSRCTGAASGGPCSGRTTA